MEDIARRGPSSRDPSGSVSLYLVKDTVKSTPIEDSLPVYLGTDKVRWSLTPKTQEEGSDHHPDGTSPYPLCGCKRQLSIRRKCNLSGARRVQTVSRKWSRRT